MINIVVAQPRATAVLHNFADPATLSCVSIRINYASAFWNRLIRSFPISGKPEDVGVPSIEKYMHEILPFKRLSYRMQKLQ